MRLNAIDQAKAALSTTIQPASAQDISGQIVAAPRVVPHEPPRQRLAGWLAAPLLTFQQPAIRSRLGFPLSFPYDRLCLGERFAHGASLAASPLFLLTWPPQQLGVLNPATPFSLYVRAAKPIDSIPGRSRS